MTRIARSLLAALFRISPDGIVKDNIGFAPLSPRARALGDGRPYALAIAFRQGLQRESGEHGKGLLPLSVQNKDPLLVA